MSQTTDTMETKTAPPDGMEDATFYFDELRSEVGAWSRKNFGDQLPHRPAMGMVEKLCELDEAIGTMDIDKALDAVGDTVVFMADYFHRRDWNLGEAWFERPRTGIFRERGSTMYLIGLLCHSHLRGEKGVRGGSVKHDAVMKDACSRVLGYLDHICQFMDRDVVGVIMATWDVVSKRDEDVEFGSAEMQKSIDSAIEELEAEFDTQPPAPFPLSPSAVPDDEDHR